MAVISITRGANGGVTFDDDTSLPFTWTQPPIIEEFSTNGIRISGQGRQREVYTTDTFTVNGAAYVPANVGALQSKLRDEVFSQSVLTNFRLLSAASTNLTSVRGTPGRLFSYDIYNNTASAKFVKFYNKATAPVIASDSALLVMTIPIGANSGRTFANVNGINFSTGIGMVITGAIGDTDATAVAANDVTVNLTHG